MKLRIIQSRPGVLYARQWHGGWMAAMLMAGMLFWIVGVAGIALTVLVTPAAVLAVAGMGAMAMAPRLMLNGMWFSIDLVRGWVHWRRRRGRLVAQESFAPQRINGIELEKRRWGWAVVLRLDHPRLSRLVLARSLRRASAAAAVEKIKTDLAERAPFDTPPPEVFVESKNRFVLPNVLGLVGRRAWLLIYAVVWCLWSWTSLVVQLAWRESLTESIKLLAGLSMIGLLLLVTALVRAVGAQALEKTEKGWYFSRRWCGCSWDRRLLRLGKGEWLRRIDFPMSKAGVWAPVAGGEIRLAPGLEPDTIAWVQKRLSEDQPRTARSRSR